MKEKKQISNSIEPLHCVRLVWCHFFAHFIDCVLCFEIQSLLFKTIFFVGYFCEREIAKSNIWYFDFNEMPFRTDPLKLERCRNVSALIWFCDLGLKKQPWIAERRINCMSIYFLRIFFTFNKYCKDNCVSDSHEKTLNTCI